MTRVGPRSADVCRRIAAARSASGLTREGLARSLTACTGSSVNTRDVRRFERWRVPWQLLDEIARLTGTSRRWLLYGEGTAPEARPGATASVDARETDAELTGCEPWRPSAWRVALGLLLGFLVGVAILTVTGSTPAAVAGLLAIVLIAFLRSAPARG
jgi:hypothetical protein